MTNSVIFIIRRELGDILGLFACFWGRLAVFDGSCVVVCVANLEVLVFFGGIWGYFLVFSGFMWGY